MHKKEDQDNQHAPVLLQEVLQYLAPAKGESYLDGTAGYAGHAQAVIDQTGSPEQTYLVDRDPQAIAALQPLAGKGAHLLQTDFYTAAQQLTDEDKQFDMILADLGVSSPHLNIASRGFSFMSEGPLDMRMDTEQDLTAGEIVNEYPESELADILWRFGEEPKARQIARRIVHNRPIRNTTDLARIVASAWPGHSKTHPATRSFQALRLVVNDELGLLERALPLWVDLLKPGGRLVVISFHSLEDRIVKRTLAEYGEAQGYEAQLHILTKKPVKGSAEEIVFNPRARSAKLRAAVKIKKERELHADSGKK
jgi:16S rRNA (cytosine1402-N4)-methyltransferase